MSFEANTKFLEMVPELIPDLARMSDAGLRFLVIVYEETQEVDPDYGLAIRRPEGTIVPQIDTAVLSTYAFAKGETREVMLPTARQILQEYNAKASPFEDNLEEEA